VQGASSGYLRPATATGINAFTFLAILTLPLEIQRFYILRPVFIIIDIRKQPLMHYKHFKLSPLVFQKRPMLVIFINLVNTKWIFFIPVIVVIYVI
jgi:hypothetical protein